MYNISAASKNRNILCMHLFQRNRRLLDEESEKQQKAKCMITNSAVVRSGVLCTLNANGKLCENKIVMSDSEFFKRSGHLNILNK